MVKKRQFLARDAVFCCFWYLKARQVGIDIVCSIQAVSLQVAENHSDGGILVFSTSLRIIIAVVVQGLLKSCYTDLAFAGGTLIAFSAMASLSSTSPADTILAHEVAKTSICLLKSFKIARFWCFNLNRAAQSCHVSGRPQSSLIDLEDYLLDRSHDAWIDVWYRDINWHLLFKRPRHS